jgi:hypothetical protein
LNIDLFAPIVLFVTDVAKLDVPFNNTVLSETPVGNIT